MHPQFWRHLPVAALLSAVLVVLALPQRVTAASGDATADLVCSACRLLAAELHAAVEQEATQGRTVEAGSFRVDPRGNQRVAKIPYARSDTHLTGVLESACERLPTRGHTPHLDGGARGYVPLTRPDGRPVDTGRLVSGSAVDNWLRMRCETLLDDHEDALKSLLRQSEPRPLTASELERRLCLETAGVCSEAGLALQFEAPIDLAAEEALVNSAAATAASAADADAKAKAEAEAAAGDGQGGGNGENESASEEKTEL